MLHTNASEQCAQVCLAALGCLAEARYNGPALFSMIGNRAGSGFGINLLRQKDDEAGGLAVFSVLPHARINFGRNGSRSSNSERNGTEQETQKCSRMRENVKTGAVHLKEAIITEGPN